MKSAPDENVDAYIRGFPADVQQILSALRKAIRQVVPEAEESTSYGIPTYKLTKGPIVYFAGYQHHRQPVSGHGTLSSAAPQPHTLTDLGAAP